METPPRGWGSGWGDEAGGKGWGWGVEGEEMGMRVGAGVDWSMAHFRNKRVEFLNYFVFLKGQRFGETGNSTKKGLFFWA